MNPRTARLPPDTLAGVVRLVCGARDFHAIELLTASRSDSLGQLYLGAFQMAFYNIGSPLLNKLCES